MHLKCNDIYNVLSAHRIYVYVSSIASNTHTQAMLFARVFISDSVAYCFDYMFRAHLPHVLSCSAYHQNLFAPFYCFHFPIKYVTLLNMQSYPIMARRETTILPVRPTVWTRRIEKITSLNSSLLYAIRKWKDILGRIILYICIRRQIGYSYKKNITGRTMRTIVRLRTKKNIYYTVCRVSFPFKDLLHLQIFLNRTRRNIAGDQVTI